MKLENIIVSEETESADNSDNASASADSKSKDSSTKMKIEVKGDFKVSKEEEKYNLVCNQLYDLARINSDGLTEDEMTSFIKRSQEIMNLMIK